MLPDHLNYLGAIYGHLKAVTGMLKTHRGYHYVYMCVCTRPHPRVVVGNQQALLLCLNG